MQKRNYKTKIPKKGYIFSPDMIQKGLDMVFAGEHLDKIVSEFKRMNPLHAYSMNHESIRRYLANHLRKNYADHLFVCKSCGNKIEINRLSKTDLRYCKPCMKSLLEHIGRKRPYEYYNVKKTGY